MVKLHLLIILCGVTRELLLHKRKMLFPSLGKACWQLGFDEVEQIYLSKYICCTAALRTKGFQAGGVPGRSGESLWIHLMSMAFFFRRYKGGKAKEEQPNELTQNRGSRFLCQNNNNNNLNEVSRDSRMNVQSDNGCQPFLCVFSLSTLAVSSQVFVVTVWTVELYMVPLALLVLFAYNFSLVTTGKVNNAQDAQASRVAVTFLAAPVCP